MKTINLIVALILLQVSTIKAQETKKKSEEITIKTSAVCSMCKQNIEKAMAYEKGVKSSNLDVKSQTLMVKYNPKKTSPEKIKKAISMTGYDADDVPADPKAYEGLNACCKKDKGVH